MKRSIIPYVAAILCFCSCNFSAGEPASRLPEPDLVERLRYQKREIDTFYIYHPELRTVWIKLDDATELVQLNPNDYPENIETFYTVLKNESGNVVCAAEEPYSTSGDWNIVYLHYFDADGKTFAFENHTYFPSICGQGIANETYSMFYDTQFNRVDSTFSLVDNNKRPLSADSCRFYMQPANHVSANVEQWLNAKGIKNME